ncbi:MAG: hypothetical protein ABI835_13345, partial [Chloroflexota bacterium]
VILIPLGVMLALKMIPSEVLAECREQAQALAAQGKPISRSAAVVIVGIWLILGSLFLLWLYGILVAKR